MENLRVRFLKVYSNIPLNLRDEIILVFEEKPITWNVAYFEVNNKTESGDKILEQLDELNLI